VEFKWDVKKNHANLKKHAVSFDEAQTVFDDPLACIFDDEWHSIGEARELIIGHSSNHRLLIISLYGRGFGRRKNYQRATSNGTEA
jgi:uncharacterized DUF497 family protein